MTMHSRCVIVAAVVLAGWTQADYIPGSGTWYSGQNAQVASAFTQNGIVSDAVDVAPLQQLIMAYNGSTFVQLGNELTPAGVTTQPAVFWPITYADQLYTLVELDLDAPTATNSSLRSVLHWLVYNIPGNDIFRGQVYAPYMGSAPFDSSLHRYVFLLFPQTRSIQLSALPSGNDARLRFNMRTFMLQNGLSQPFAGNFYRARADDYSRQYWASQGVTSF
ncbi:protein D3-like [Paramacrobiotus metropolitanus]|uniref:protein D3-like n=1 Tax=Paramacrobiotus metropolitanus TaxID=2943436 RepID=UPI002445BE63|nr:protein D3-like [Paramacrobiotus metropolitanus]